MCVCVWNGLRSDPLSSCACVGISKRARIRNVWNATVLFFRSAIFLSPDETLGVNPTAAYRQLAATKGDETAGVDP